MLAALVQAHPQHAQAQQHAKGQQLAFPGAEGAARFARGGRAGRVFEVTSLADSGPGSLREALEAAEPRTVVFRVAGTIELQSELVIGSAFVTVAGQTAPGDGIALKGHGLTVAADEVILRYLRVRPGADTGGGSNAISLHGGDHIVVDHCSASWAARETLEVKTSGSRVTVQWCILSESLACASAGGECRGHGSLVLAGLGSEVSFHHNLYAHHRTRSPRLGNSEPQHQDPQGLLFDFRNNVVYNWAGRYAGHNADLDSVSRSNFVANYYLTGPDSQGQLAYRDSCVACKSYFEGNRVNGLLPVDPWQWVQLSGFSTQQALSYRSGQPFATPPVTTQGSSDAYASVLRFAGANHPRRDPSDERVVNTVGQATGRIINSTSAVGGWPRLSSELPPEDTDRDGMPDMWEFVQGLNPNDPSDGALDRNVDGYTNLEDYLNELVAPPGSTPPGLAPPPPPSSPAPGSSPPPPPGIPDAGAPAQGPPSGPAVGQLPLLPPGAGGLGVPVVPVPVAGFAPPPPGATRRGPDGACSCGILGAGRGSGWPLCLAALLALIRRRRRPPVRALPGHPER
ncbi:MAG: pectate lyase [Proteobacteria bacterium]|nr:pectate lyase [Pseudomonadota bacterium]